MKINIGGTAQLMPNFFGNLRNTSEIRSMLKLTWRIQQSILVSNKDKKSLANNWKSIFQGSCKSQLMDQSYQTSIVVGYFDMIFRKKDVLSYEQMKE